jgi:dolichol-phosphate mannosyltransferase
MAPRAAIDAGHAHLDQVTIRIFPAAMPGLLILVPTLNEGRNIETAITRIAGALPDAHILIIDDVSSDGTWEKAEAMKAELPRLDVMVRRGKQPGLGHSIIDGYRYALDKEFEEVCIVDCDMQQDPADVARMRSEHPDADIVVGSRALARESFVEGYDFASKLLSNLSNFGIRLMFLMSVGDATTDFFRMRTRVLEKVPPEALSCKGYALFAEVKIRAHKAGFSIAELPVQSFVRDAGESKRSYRQVVSFAREILGLWWRLLLPGGGAAGQQS